MAQIVGWGAAAVAAEEAEAQAAARAAGTAPGVAVAVAIDGKKLRGSGKQKTAQPYVVAAVTHGDGVVLGHTGMQDRESEIPTVQKLLQELPVAGRVVTVDALHTQRDTAAQVRAQGGDYVMIVKSNQPGLAADIKEVFAAAPFCGEQRDVARTVDKGHGRIEVRELTTSTALEGYCDWPSHAQVFRVVRRRVDLVTGKVSVEVHYGITSLGPERANAAQLLGWCRGHWTIENRQHWVRDVVYQEDYSQVRRGSIPQVMAVLRAGLIGLLHWSGWASVAKAHRHYEVHPREAAGLLWGRPA